MIEHDWSFVRKVKSDVLSKGGMLSGICSGCNILPSDLCQIELRFAKKLSLAFDFFYHSLLSFISIIRVGFFWTIFALKPIFFAVSISALDRMMEKYG